MQSTRSGIRMKLQIAQFKKKKCIFLDFGHYMYGVKVAFKHIYLNSLLNAIFYRLDAAKKNKKSAKSLVSGHFFCLCKSEHQALQVVVQYKPSMKPNSYLP